MRSCVSYSRRQTDLQTAMPMTPGLRKLAFTTHVTSSIGWVGAVVVFLVLAGVGLTSQEPQIVRGVYLVMEHAAWLTLVPFALASLVTGLVMSLGTTWGLFRHYWVVFKLLITVFATLVLLVYMQTFREMATVAANPDVGVNAVRNPSPLVHAVLALLILLVATVLAIYKPQALTPYGRRKQLEQRMASQLCLQSTILGETDGPLERRQRRRRSNPAMGQGVRRSCPPGACPVCCPAFGRRWPRPSHGAVRERGLLSAWPCRRHRLSAVSSRLGDRLSRRRQAFKSSDQPIRRRHD